MQLDPVDDFAIGDYDSGQPVAEPKSRSEEIARDLLNKETEKAGIEKSIESETSRVKKINEEVIQIRKTLEFQLEVLAKEKFEIEDKIHAERRKIRELSEEILQLQKLLDLELAKERATAEFQANVQAFDKRTLGLPWREWAFGYQIDGGKILANNKKAILADKRGLGKSLTSLIAMDMVQSNKAIIVCPADVVSGFRNELKRWAPHREVIEFYKMSKKVRDATFSILTFLKQYTILINYEIWRKDDTFIDQLISLRCDTIIIDEAHNIKETDGIAFTGIRRLVMAANVCPRCGAADKQEQIKGTMQFVWTCTNKECGWIDRDDPNYNAEDRMSIKYVFPMTGTPILNRPQELFPLLHLILPQVFVTIRDFLVTFCQRNYKTGYWEWQSGALNRLSVLLAGRFLMRTKEMVGLELPPQTVTVHEIELDPEEYPDQWRVMQQLKQYAQIVLSTGKSLSAIATIAQITRLRQVNVYPAGIQVKDTNKESPTYGTVIFSVGDEVRESIKLDKALSLIKEFTEDGARVVLFSQFQPGLHELKHRLDAEQISTCILDGTTNPRMREFIKKDFDRTQTDPKESQWQVVLCNFKVGGVGLNLTGATETIILDEEWNPGMNDQGYGRTDRIGQTEETGVHIIRIKNSIDTWMAQLIEFKAGVIGGFETQTQDLSRLLLDALEKGEV